MADMDVTARFRADISDMQSKMRSLEKGLADVKGETDKSSKGFTILRGTIATALGNAAIGAIRSAGRAMQGFASSAIDAAEDSIRTEKRIVAVAQSMGVFDSAMGGSIKRLTDFAQELQNQTGVSDETIKSGQALLLTFSNVANSVGEMGGMFDRATAATLDLAAVGFGDVTQNAKALGKALQDPIRGITALSRQGVTFTDQEKEKIKTLTESGQILQAQELIMAGVEKQVKGTAAQTATAGEKMKASFDDFKETLGLAVLPLIQQLQTWVTNTLLPVMQRFANNLKENLLPRLQQMGQLIRDIGPTILALVGPIAAGVAAFYLFNQAVAIMQAVRGAIAAATAAQIAMNIAAYANPYVLVAAAAIAQLAAWAIAIKVVYDRSEEFREAVAELWQTIKTIAEVILNDVIKAFSGFGSGADSAANSSEDLLSIFQKVVKFLGGSFAMQAKLLQRLFIGIGNTIRIVIKAFEIVNKVAVMVASLFRVGMTKAINVTRGAIGGLLDRLGPLGTALRRVASTVASAFSNIAGFIRSAFSNALSVVSGAINTAIDFVNKLIEAYNKLPGVTKVSTIGAFEFTGFSGGGPTSSMARPGEEGLARAPSNYGNVGGGGDRKKEKDEILDMAGATGKAAAAENKRAEALKRLRVLLREYTNSMRGAKSALNELAALTTGRFGEMSEVMSSLGEGGSIGQTISLFDQASASVRNFFEPFTDVSLFGKKAAGQAKAAMDAVREELRAATQYAIDQFRERERLQNRLTELDNEYAAKVAATNTRYDALDAAAQQRLQEINDKWDKEIPILQEALTKATEAFDAENSVLQGLISERNEFTNQIASGFRSFMNELSFKGGAASIRKQFQKRLQEMRTFTNNIRTLVAKGLDPALIQEFVTAGVSGAGATVKALTKASAADIAAINEAQAGLGSEIGSFGQYASDQWFNAGIAQQEAIVAPMQTAKDQAQAALDTANELRASEIAAQEAHIESIKTMRDQELANHQAWLDSEKAIVEQQIKDVNASLATNAANVTNTLNSLQQRLPEGMLKAGQDSINGLIKGFSKKDKDLKKAVKGLSNNVVKTLKEVLGIASPSKVTKGLGQEIAEGLVKGLEGSERMVERAASGLAQAGIPNVAFAPGIGPRQSSGTVINVTVNAGVGTSGAEVGRQIVDALKQYERRNGPVYAKA